MPAARRRRASKESAAAAGRGAVDAHARSRPHADNAARPRLLHAPFHMKQAHLHDDFSRHAFTH